MLTSLKGEKENHMQRKGVQQISATNGGMLRNTQTSVP